MMCENEDNPWRNIRFIKEDLALLTEHKNPRIAYTAGVLLHQRTLEEEAKGKHDEWLKDLEDEYVEKVG